MYLDVSLVGPDHVTRMLERSTKSELGGCQEGINFVSTSLENQQ